MDLSKPSETNPPSKPEKTSKEERPIRQYLVKYMSMRLDRMPEEDGAVDIGTPHSKGKKEVFYIFYPSGKKTVLRSFEKQAYFERYAAAMQYSKGEDLPIPQLILLDGSRATWGHHRHRFIEEEFVEGSPLADLERNPLQAEACIRALATLHNETSAQWGRLANLKNGSFKEHFEGRINKLFQELGSYAEHTTWGELGMWHGWFGLQLEQMKNPNRLNLIHENISAENILLSPDNQKATFTSNGRLRFGIFVRDLEKMLETLAGEDEEKRRAYLSLYMQAQTHLKSPKDYEEEFRIYRAEHFLRRYRTLMKRKSEKYNIPDEKIAKTLVSIRKLIW